VDGSSVDTATTGTTGTVIGGPVDLNGYRWYEVAYNNGVTDGWSKGGNLLYSRFEDQHLAEPRQDLAVYDGPGYSNTQVDTAPAEGWARVVGGPVDAEGSRWWKLNYGGDVQTGWSVDFWLDQDR